MNTSGNVGHWLQTTEKRLARVFVQSGVKEN